MTTLDATLTAFLKAIHENPFAKTDRLVFADWCEENGHAWAAKPLRDGRIPLFGQDVEAVVALKECRYAPATWDKKFARNLEMVDNSLTPRQYLWMWILLRKYRRSVRNKAIRDEAEKRNLAYQALVAAEVVKPEYKPIPENDRTQEHYRKKRHTHKTNQQAKEVEMPLFD